MKGFIFWSIMTVPVVILFIIWPWLIYPYLIAGAFGAGIYYGEFEDDAKIGGGLTIFIAPHIYFFIRLLVNNRGGWI